VAAGADAQVGVGLGHPEPLDEPARQRLVVVLAGVQQPHVDAVARAERLDHGRHLHEVRAGADHGEDGGHGGSLDTAGL
jgi:hypothetical protein